MHVTFMKAAAREKKAGQRKVAGGPFLSPATALSILAPTSTIQPQHTLFQFFAGTRAFLASEFFWYQDFADTGEMLTQDLSWHQGNADTREMLTPEKCWHQRNADTGSFLVPDLSSTVSATMCVPSNMVVTSSTPDNLTANPEGCQHSPN
jgi:hypothetical protein